MFTKGGQTGQDMYGIEGTSSNYPHDVIGYDNNIDVFIGTPPNIAKINQYTKSGIIRIYTIDGKQVGAITNGIYIIRQQQGETTKIVIK